MKYSQELEEIVNKKNFKHFWQCYTYLIDAGFTAMDAFGVSVKHFGEGKIWANVAWIRFESVQRNNNPVMDPITGQIAAIYNGLMNPDDYTIRQGPITDIPPQLGEIIIGIVDETNIHLSGMYDIYRKSLLGAGLMSSEVIGYLEKTCEVIRIKSVPCILEIYIEETFKKHFDLDFSNHRSKIQRNKLVGQLSHQPRNDLR